MPSGESGASQIGGRHGLLVEWLRDAAVSRRSLLEVRPPLRAVGGGPVEDEDTVIGEEGTDAGETITTSIPLDVVANASVATGDIGASLSGDEGQDVSSRSISSATGVAGKGGDDDLSNTSMLTVSASSTTVTGNATLNVSDSASANADVVASAIAVGLDGGGGADTITNSGTIEAVSSTLATTLAGEITLVDVEGGEVDAFLTSSASAIAMSGGNGSDTIINSGMILAGAFSGGLASSYAQNIIGNGSTDTPIFSSATSIGMAGGDGGDSIANHGTIQSLAFANAFIGNANFALRQGFATIEAGVTSVATASGLDGGAGNDFLLNTNQMSVGASALTSSVAIESAPVGTDELTQVASIDGSPVGIAHATAMNGGDGRDTVDNQGTLTINADASAIGGEVDLAAIGSSRATAALRAEAVATGMDGGTGSDTITNQGTIDTTADSDVVVATIAAGVDLVPFVPLTQLGAEGDAVSSSQAVGINGGAGDDSITNSGTITSTATATMTAVEVSVTLGISTSSGTSTGGSGGGGGASVASEASAAAGSDELYTGDLVSTSTSRLAAAAGILGGDDDDTITNTGAITSSASATSTEVNVSASVGLDIGAALAESGGPAAVQGVGEANADDGVTALAQTTVHAAATGIDGGAGDDSIINSAGITSTAEAIATDVAVKANIAIPTDPVSALIPAVLTASDASGMVDALATGIAGGAGHDFIQNDAAITADAESDVDSIIANLETQVVVPLPFLFDPIAEANSTTQAEAIGIHGDAPDSIGFGNDTIINNAMITSKAVAGSLGVNVNITAAGAALGSSESIAHAIATAIDGGAGDDSLMNHADLIVTADAASGADEVQALLLQGAAISNASTNATATAAGIVGGQAAEGITDDDVIYNDGSIDVDANADSNTLLEEYVIGLGASLAFAETVAEATAVGIDGAAGDDVIVTEGPVSARADADAQAESNAFIFSPLGGGAATADNTGTRAEATATGLDGGDGNDRVEWHDTVDAIAVSESGSDVVAALSLGASLGFSGTEANATSIGAGGGAGNDVITGSGHLTASSTADNSSVGVEISAVGASVGFTDTLVNAISTGIDGGDGNDTVMTDAVITSIADAGSGSVNVGVSVVGGAVSSSETIITADAAGIDGGGGNDVISGGAEITATSTADTSVVGVEVSGGGASVGVTDTDVTANATGVRGGDGNDTVMGLGPITADATSTSGAVDVLVSVVGAAVGNSETTVNANATGVDGGAGDDVVIIDDTITSMADATNGSTGVAVALVGAGVQNAQVNVDADATGAAGGDGNDGLLNNSTITTTATANGESNGVNVNLVGAALGDASMDASATATGMDGGAGDDIVDNQGTIDVDASSTMNFSSVSFTLAGAAVADVGDADTIASTHATGMTGGEGNDVVLNNGTVDVDGDASMTTGTNSSIAIAGFAGTTAIMSGEGGATGLAGGDGDDFIANLTGGVVTSNAGATANLLSGTSFSFAGVAGDDADITATATATGIDGGAGGNTILNESSVSATATSMMDVDSNSTVIFGVSSSSATTDATTNAFGIVGGDLNDVVENTGTLNATSTATTTTTHSSYVFAGGASSDAVLTAQGNSTGISTGDGADWINNSATGIITVNASSVSAATGGTSATFGGATSSGTVGSTVSGVGIDAGAGDDTVINDGILNTFVNSTVSSSNTSNGGFLFGDAGSESGATADESAIGMALGDGDDVMMNSGDITVRNNFPADQLTVSATSNSGGGDVTLEGDGVANADASLTTALAGIKGGDGDDTIMQDGTLTVINDPRVSASSTADGDGFDGDGFGLTQVSIGTFDAPASAVGIDGGDGDSAIVNTGTMTVMSQPTGGATANIDGDNAGSADAIVATTVRAEAVGIRTGDGANTIMNSGDMVIRSLPTASASSIVGGGWAGTDSARADAAAVATAIGIQAGDGGNTIVNTGLIDVLANPTANAFADDSDDSDPEEFVTETEVATAIGIQTGSGDDTIVNAGEGVIVASEQSGTGNGTAITTGGGDDVVELIEDSFVHGTVELGAGDDVIAFADDSGFTGGVFGGTGSDTLRILDRRVLSFAPGAFSSVERLEVNQGTIQVNGDYSIAAGGALQAELFNGGHGLLEINGDSGIGAGSELIVIARPRAYLDGETFDVMTGDSISGVFDAEVLPESTFLSSTVNYLPDAVQVEIGVVPFEEVAHNKVQRAVGGYLDSIAPSAMGEMAEIIGEFQLLSDQSDINTAFTGLSPDSYDSATRATLDINRDLTRMLNRRMRSIRQPDATAVPNPAGQFTFANGNPQDVQEGLDLPADPETQPIEWRTGPWMSVFGQWGGQDSEDGFTGFDQLTTGVAVGYDDLVSDNFLLGGGLMFAATDVDLDHSFGGGDIESLAASLYGSWFHEDWWLNGSLSYGLQSYDNHRRVTVGMFDATASSDHDGDLFSAALDGGFRFDLNDEWRMEPYAGLNFMYLDEEGFQESGAGSANLIVEGRSTDALISEIGVRFAAEIQGERSTVSPFIGLAWVHDFEIDDRTITSGFVGAPGTSFTLDGLETDADRAHLEAGIGITRGSTTMKIEYVGEFSGGYDSHGLLGSISIQY